MSVPAQVLLPGFEGSELPRWVERRLESGMAGVCLFATNISSRAQLSELTTAIRSANPHAIIAVDEEGGDVTRLDAATGSPYPGNAWLGRFDDLTETERQGRLIAEELRAVGCNLNLAPCVDINCNQENPVIGVRSFGATADLVARHGAAWIRGHQGVGVATCPKHFPGHGDTSEDSHLALPTVDRTLDELLDRELRPFRAAIAADAWAVMTSHIMLPQLDPDLPATLSRPILGALLRDNLGFTGAVVSDAIDMAGASAGRGIPEATVLALAAGCDLLCIGSGNTDDELDDIEAAIDSAIANGRLSAERLDDAAARVRTLAQQVAVDQGALVERRPDEILEPADVASHFAFTPHAAHSLARRPREWSLVKIDTAPGIAAGPMPWGPFAVLAQDPKEATGFSAVSSSDIEPDSAGSPAVVLVGRNNHRHAWVRELIDRWRLADPNVLVVDMGWPSDDRAYADIATFGSSRLIGLALLDLLSAAASREPDVPQMGRA